VGLDYLTPEEEIMISDLKEKKAIIEQRIEGYQNYQKVLHMINKRSKVAAQQPNLEIKDICGYDGRLAMNEAEFAMWCNTNEGKTALSTDTIGPRTAETKHLGAHIPYPGQVIPDAPDVMDALKSICLKGRKKCKHFSWRDLHNQDFLYNQKILKDELARLSKREADIVDDAETREATKGYHSNNTTEQLF
jgi:COMPASS component SPP1